MSSVNYLLIAALVIYMIVRRFAGSPVGATSMLVPIGLTIYGIVALKDGLHGTGVTGVDLAMLAVEIGVGVIAGLARGATIKLYVRDGHLWQRYTVATLLVWIAMIALRVGFAAGGQAVGMTLSTAGVAMAAFGISILVESLVVSKRALRTGAPIMPTRSRRSSRRPAGIR